MQAEIAEDLVAELTPSQADLLVDCYVALPDLLAVARANSRNPEEVMRELLPTAPHVRSGDFGEILFTRALSERSPHPIFPLRRWRGRATPNDTVRGIDLLGYCAQAARAAPTDILVLCEVRTRSATSDPEVLKNALESIGNDYVTRLASQLLFHQMRLQREGQQAAVTALARFADPIARPYVTQLVAAVAYDAHLWLDTFYDALPERHGIAAKVEIAILSVCNLSSWITALYDRAPSVVANASRPT